jgi:serine/threonine protein kinase
LEYLEILHNNKIIHGDIKPENILQTKLDNNIKKLIKKININSILQKYKFKKNKKNNQLTNEIRKLFCDQEESVLSEESESSDTESEIIEIDDISEDEVDDEDDVENKKISNIKPCNVKLIDIGTCVNQDTDTRRKTIQTCYYQSPEILLKLQYNEKCDIWALGCTIYEILTNKILFDADDYNGNENRYQIYLIVQKLGMIPQHMIKKSKYKQIIFTNNCKKIRGFTKINFLNNLRKELNDILSNYKFDEKKKLSFINLLLSFLEIDPEKRISSQCALQNEIFK